MKTQIDIITGFLGSGKTTFINGILESDKNTQNRTVIIQDESGEVNIDTELFVGKSVYINKLEKGSKLDAQFIYGIMKKYLPHKIIIECNGMDKMEEILVFINDKRIYKGCTINKIINIIDAVTFDMYMDNFEGILADQISYSDLIVVNNTENSSKSKLNLLKSTLKSINKSINIVFTVKSEIKNSLDYSELMESEKRNFSKPSGILFVTFILLVTAYLIFSILRSIDVNAIEFDLSGLQVLNTVFISILIQAFPFILIGVFISSIIQVFVTSDNIVKIFPQKLGIGYFIAIIAGLFLPLCDCAVVPIAVRLVKKGVPLPVAVTFMLSAPIVNPIVIASTLYAFPNQPSIAFSRVYIGITVALAVGLMFKFFPEDEMPLTFGTKIKV